MTPIVFLDTETTGLNPELRRVWEVAMIRRDDRGEREIQFFIDIDMEDADPFALDIGGYWERHPGGRRQVYGSNFVTDDLRTALRWGLVEEPGTGGLYTEASAAQVIAHWTHGAHVVGAAPSFDTISLDALLREHHQLPKWHYHLMDVENLALGYLAGQRAAGLQLRDEAGDLQPPWNSHQLSAAIGVPEPPEAERHTALGDARWAKRIYDKVLPPPRSGLQGLYPAATFLNEVSTPPEQQA